MCKYLALGIACLTLGLSGLAHASQINDCNDHGNDKNKCDYRCDDDQSYLRFDCDYHFDLRGKCDFSKFDDKDKCKDMDKDKHCEIDWRTEKHHPDFCDVRCDRHDDRDRCDRDDHCRDNCHEGNPCSVPLPASSAMGGLGVIGVALVGWLRRRHAAIA